jgi:transcription antitermination protein NusB
MTDPGSTQDNKRQSGDSKRQARKPHRGKGKHHANSAPLFNAKATGGRRHQARILALQVLYEVDVTDHELTDVLARTTEDTDEVVTDAVRTHVDRLVRGATAKREQIDKYIGEAAPAFPVNQLPAVDRNVLRLAIYELLNEPDVPRKAAINEAVELAKRFGGMNSSRFVNGVLGTVTDRLSAEQPKSSDSTDSATSS